ncbi:tail fiber assembly protein [Escherichia coli]|nr:tail fiber assembly protein [Escherichia coli]EGO4965903.1 tail fiber assembly protein [Escherichia coli]EHC2516190.1 tail fiber assembly protein [Escherichia coli]ELF8958637.1 tail fiber assembly protein [Escherichia coli]
MNVYYYSAMNNAFYLAENIDLYKEQNTWPSDAIKVEDSLFDEFNSPPPGKIRAAGENGLPVWIDIPQPTHGELISIAESKKKILISDANRYISSKQWPGKAAIGRLKDDELAQYNLWLDYLDALEMVDTSSAPDIEWPTPPEVQAR